MIKKNDLNDVLLITWHGIHELDIFPGLPDTGGQNIYVQNMAEMIHDKFGARVFILNRGGFTHPYTERMREGYSKDPDRELYVLHVADEVPAFLRKEYLTGALIEMASEKVLEQLPKDYQPDMIISHFWDGGLMARFLKRTFTDTPHIWVPHEPVGMKKAPMPDLHHERHSIPSRERYEALVAAEADAIGSTSKLTQEDLQTSYDGRYDDKIIDIFPGVNTERFHPGEDSDLSGSQCRLHAEFLSMPEELFTRPHICEFGRSDSLKDKDKAVEVFARVAQEDPEIHMFMNLDERMEPGIGRRIRQIVNEAGIEDRITIFSPEQLPQNGHGSEIMPDIIRTSRLFLSMSVMEGFGMAACEAAASGVPVVGTDQIPVVTDIIEPAGGGKVVPGKHVEEAAAAVLEILRLSDDEHQAMARKAYESVIPRYRWDTIVEDMFDQFARLKN